MKGSIVIIAFFLLGGLMAYAGWIPAGWAEQYNLSHIALMGLIFCVGFSIGHDPAVWQRFRSLDVRLAWLPVLTMTGTIAGSLVAALMLDRSVTECLAVGSGYGYYSLSSVLIADHKGADLGTVALLCNIFREMSVLLFTPFMVRFLGKLAPIAAGGATTMDTTLPVIVRYCGEEMAFVSLFHAFIIDFSVPFWVTFFCNL